MKLFAEHELVEALQHAAAGGQALHVFSNPSIYPGAPACFKNINEAGHLFDQDIERLMTMAKCLGVREVFVSHRATGKQHIDLCRGPLKKAKLYCSEPQLF